MKRVRAIYHQDGESWWAESPDAPGWSAAADDLDELRRVAREGLHFFLDEEVIVLDDTTVPVVGGNAFLNSTSGELRFSFGSTREAQVEHDGELANV